MDFDAVVVKLAEVLSGVRAKGYVAEIARHHRIQASPGFDDALADVRRALERIGVETKTSSFQADGRTETLGWIAPTGWRIRSGSLQQIEPKRRRLCSYAEVPISVLGQSGAGRAEGELIHIGRGTSDEDVDGVELEGRFVLASGRPSQVLARIRGRGIAGLIQYPESERAAASYDLVQYAGLFPTAKELDTTPMGFSISRREADRLIGELARGAVRLVGEIDAEAYDGSMNTLEAEIPGSDPDVGEVLVVAHLCHPRPSANDNASGSGLMIEVARALVEMGKTMPLRNSVRLLWVAEFNGAIPWAMANAERLRTVRFVVNLDMVGQSPELLGEPLRVFRIPNARPSFLNACYAPILDRIADDEATRSRQGSRRPLHWIVDRPSGGSDHLVFQASPHALPAVMFGHDDPYWHTDQDTIEKVDPTRLKHVGLLTALLATLPTWGKDEAERLGRWLMRFGVGEIARAASLAGRAGAGQRLVEVAREIERRRAASLRDLIGERVWDRGAHEAALDAVATTMGGHKTVEGRFDGVRPHCIVDGPVRSEIMTEWSDEERAFAEEMLSGNHRAVVESLTNLCDGTNTIEEIALRLTLDFDRLFSIEDTQRGIELLVKAGYLAT